MTTINTFEDILDVLARDPQLREAMRQHVLDEELRQLPAIVHDLRATVNELARVLQEFMTAANARLARLEAGLAELSRVLQEFMTATNERLARLEAGQDELRAGQEELKAGQEELRAGQDELKAGQDELRKDLTRMERRQNRMENDLSDVRGQLVPLAARRMVGRIADVTNSRRPRWLDNTDIIDIADEADTSAVPPNELDSFRAIDLALRAIDKDSPDNREQYIVIECTATITRNDIVRSERNAGYMSRFTGHPAQAVVVGYSIPDDVAELAQERAVHCVIATNKSAGPARACGHIYRHSGESRNLCLPAPLP